MPHEAHLDRLFQAALDSHDGAVIDVGANLGQTLDKVVRIGGPDRQYLGFEPQVICAAAVRTRILDAGLKNHQIIPLALADQAGLQTIRQRGSLKCRSDSGVASLVDGFRPDAFYTQSEPVFAVVGDAMLEALGITEVGVIKADVEGGELEVFMGLCQTLDRHKPFLVFEVLGPWLLVTNASIDPTTRQFRERRAHALGARLHRHGYEVYRAMKDHTLVRQHSLSIGDERGQTQANCIAVHSSRKQAFFQTLKHYTNAT